MSDKASVLVVANRTAESDELLEALKARAEKGPAAFTLLVPSTPHGMSWAADMHSGGGEAQEHLDRAVERYREAGLEVVEYKVGDPDPVACVEDAVNFESYDEVIVSTLPKHLSKWLKLDLPSRVGRVTGLPTTHVSASEVKAGT
jgi:nucleotide-binding universal stress UspA family protein